MLLMVERGITGETFRGMIETIDIQNQIINIWKITINALNQYFLCIKMQTICM